MNKKIIVKQSGYKDCASSCLLSIIRYYGGNISKEELDYIINTNVYGTSAYDMVLGMGLIGFSGYGKRVAVEDISKEEHNFPLIAHVKSENNYHYIVIYKVDNKKQKFEVMDPAFGFRKITFKEMNDMFLNTILIFKKIKEIPCLNEKNELLYFILNIFKSKKRLIIKVSILSLIVTLLSLINSFYMKLNVDYLIQYKNTTFLMISLILFIFIILLKNILSYIRDYFIRTVEFDLSKKLNQKVINHLFNIPYRYFKSKPSGEILSRINDLENVKDFLSNVFLSLFVDIFVVVFSCVLLLFINTKLTFFTFINVILYLIITFIYKNIFQRNIFYLQTTNSNYQSSLIENFNSYETIRNLNCISRTIDSLNYNHFKYIKSLNDFKKKISLENIIKNIIFELGVILIYFYGSKEVMKGNMTLGDLIAFATINLYFLESVKSLSIFIVSYVYSLASYKRINELLLIKKDEVLNKKKFIKGNIFLENLSYVVNNNYLFKNLNLNFIYGKKYLVYGISGSGKSTIMKIIRKYIDNYEGKILINNINLKDISKEEIYSSILYIGQNENLYNKTIEENIKNGSLVNSKTYNEILSLVLVDKIIDKKAFRDKDIVEENGFNLSGGERQKIILARALLNDFNYLILDETLSEVGQKEEEIILNNIIKKYKDKTIIYITHKKNAENLFDEKVYLERNANEL